MRNHFGRHARHRSTGRNIRHDHGPGTDRCTLADMHSLYDANRRTNINLIVDDSTMTVQTTDRGEVSEVNIVTYHCRGIDDHRTAVQQQEAIAYLCGSRNVDMILLRHPPSDEP